MTAKIWAFAWVHEFDYAWRGIYPLFLPIKCRPTRTGTSNDAVENCTMQTYFQCLLRSEAIKRFLSNKTSLQEQPPVLRRCLNQRLCSAITHFNCYTPFPPPSFPPERTPQNLFRSSCLLSICQLLLHLFAVFCGLFIHPSTPPSSIVSLSIPLRLSVVPSLITAHPEDGCLLISYPSFPLCVCSFIPAISVFLPSLRSLANSQQDNVYSQGSYVSMWFGQW